jgi:hypothetical protein
MIPKSGNRFSGKIMLKTKNQDHGPIQLNWIANGTAVGGVAAQTARSINPADIYVDKLFRNISRGFGFNKEQRQRIDIRSINQTALPALLRDLRR